MNVLRPIQAMLHRQEPREMAGDDLDFTSADRRTLSEHLKIAFLAMVVGALAGGAAILFRSVVDGVTFGAAGFQTGGILDLARSLPWWHVLLMPAAGGLLIGWFVQSVSYERRLHGVPDVIVASFLRQGRLPSRAGVGAALVSAVSAGVGASVGREGPMVHMGASVGSWIAQRLGLRPYDSKTLLACGVAAGIAASFNVPVGGTIFAFELIIRRYSIQRLAPIVIAAVVGTALIRTYYGDFPAWHVPERILVSYWEFPAFALLGVICACTGFVLIRCVGLVGHAMNRLAIPPMLRPALGGLGVGAIAVFFPHVLGIGYEATDEALREALPFALLVALVIAKIAATALSLGAGFGGGIFSPSLVIGAMTGGASTDVVVALGRFGQLLGRTFQIADDLLDVTAAVEAVGKPVGKDANAGKQTFPRCVGIAESRAAAQDAAKAAIAELPPGQRAVGNRWSSRASTRVRVMNPGRTGSRMREEVKVGCMA